MMHLRFFVTWIDVLQVQRRTHFKFAMRQAVPRAGLFDTEYS